MGRVRRPAPRSRVPLHRLVRTQPALVRRWLAVAVLCSVTALLVGRSIADAEQARARWGTTVPVLVSHVAVERGDALAPLVSVRRWPTAVVPPDAVHEIDPAATAAADLDAGVPLTPSALRLPTDDVSPRSEVAVPLGPGSMSFDEGQVVDLWSTLDRSLAVGPNARVVTERVAAGAVVADDSTPQHVVVAVTAEEAEAVVEALAVATVIPVVVG